MKSRNLLLSSLLVFSITGAVGAQEAKPASPPPATAKPASDATKIRLLVLQLGDGDYQKREEASRQLKAFGKAALPHLKAALTDPDIEVVSRAQALIRKIETRTLPGGPLDPNAELRPSRVKLSADNGARVLEVTDDQRELRISQSDDGIVMSVTGDVDGERVTEEFTAKDPATLQKENPEAFALYERWTGPGNGPGFILRGPMQMRGGVQIAGRAGNIQLVGPGMVVGPAGAPDELDLLRLRLEKQFREKEVKPDEREAVVAELAKLTDARLNGDMEAYTARADDMRKTLEKHKLDAGDLLPPPAKARLGVSIFSGPNADGLTVQRIADKSRGERIGLQVGDVIRLVDGKEVKTVADLRKSVTTREKGLTMDITRDGKELKLEEKEATDDKKPADEKKADEKKPDQKTAEK